MRTINRGLGSNVFRQYGMGESGRTAIEVMQYPSFAIIDGLLVLNNRLLTFNDRPMRLSNVN